MQNRLVRSGAMKMVRKVEGKSVVTSVTRMSSVEEWDGSLLSPKGNTPRRGEHFTRGVEARGGVA